MDALAGGINIKRSLDNWRKNRIRLAAAIKPYLAACTDLNTVCACASRQTYDRKDLESALAVVNAELEGLASEAESLCSAKTSLAVTRNLSTTLAPIHTLPPEILTHIFMMVPLTHKFAGISSYWRQVALGTPSLWASMRLANQTRFTYDYLSLERSNGLPLYFYVTGHDLDDEDLIDEQLAFLNEALPQIRTLDIKANSQYPEETNVNSVLETWLENSPAGTTRELRLHVGPSFGRFAARWDMDIFSTERAEAVLSALSVLHLWNILIPCSSAAYHSLVDLRLSDEGSLKKVELSVSQLAGVFLASPNLSILKISGSKILPSSGPNRATTLVHLEVLCLVNLDDESLRLVMSLIPLSHCLGELSIGLEPDGSNSGLIEDFLRDAPIKTLVCTPFGKQRGQWPLLLSTAIPSLKHLIIRQFESLKPSDIETLMVELEERKTEHGLNKELLPHLLHVYLVSGNYDDDDLAFITRMLGVQTLHVARCDKLERRGKLSQIEAKLPEAPPNSICTFTEMDTTAEWLCCMMCDRWA